MSILKSLGQTVKNGVKTITGNIFPTAVSAGQNMLGGFINEFFADRAREKNFQTNERAAEAADKRQRRQYEDYYSPQAMMEQYAAAGLSPSMMMSGGQSAIGSGAAGNMAGGASGGYPSAGTGNPFMDLQMQQMKADIENTNADTEQKKIQNEISAINKEMSTLASSQYAKEFTLLNMNLMQGDKYVTYSNLADGAKDYNEFWDKVKEATEYADTGIKAFMSSEAGQQTMRAIYESYTAFKHDIAVLSSEKVNAEFQEQIAQFLKNSDYAKTNAETAVNQLKALSAESQLSETQKNAWNHLLDKLGDSTWKDIIIVLAQVLGQYAAKANISINTGNTNYNTTDNGNKVWNKWAVDTNGQ